MPKAYSDKERREIIRALKDAAAESIAAVGIKRTTVDDLVAKAHIPKGTFYLFYASKELLIYDVFMDIHAKIHSKMAGMASALTPPVSADNLTRVVLAGFEMVRDTGLYRLMVDGEIDALLRKLPDELVEAHHNDPSGDLLMVGRLMPGASEETLMKYSGAFTALFLATSYRREIGDAVFDDALALLVKGLCIQMLGGQNDYD